MFGRDFDRVDTRERNLRSYDWLHRANRAARFQQHREASGYENAEAGGKLMAREVNLTIASVTAGWISAEQIFAVVGVLATDLVIGCTPGTVGVTAGEVIVPSRVSSAGNIALSVGNLTSVAIAAAAALDYNLVIYRR